jgi:hypothetical protein
MSQKTPDDFSDQQFDHRGEKDFEPDFVDVDERAEMRSTLRNGGTVVINAADLGAVTENIDLRNLSSLDDRLLDMAAKRYSFERMYDELGEPEWTSAAKIGTRVRTLLAAFTLDSVEQKALLLRDLVKLRDIIFEQLEGDGIHIDADGELTGREIAPAWASAMVRLLKEWRSTIESMQTDLEGDRASIREAHAQIMFQALTVMFERFVLRLEEAAADEFSDIEFKASRTALMGIFGDVMPLGFESLQSNVDVREKRLRADG